MHTCSYMLKKNHGHHDMHFGPLDGSLIPLTVMQNNNMDLDTSCQFNWVKSFQLSEPLFSNVQNGILIFILYSHQED